MANADVQASGEWDWLEESPLRIGCALVFARDVTQDQVFGAFDVDPSSAHTEDWEFDPEDRRIRVGRLGTWTFAIDESMESLHLAIHGGNVGQRLSAGTEAVVIEWTAKPTEAFEYWTDGTLMTRFEPYRVCDRDGSEPDRFLDEMRRLGMVTEADDEAEGPEDVLSATLDLMTLALGIRLPEEVAFGPLATVSLDAGR
jgi:Family of unknown function (DUF6461)